MKVRLEVVYNDKKAQSKEINYQDFDVEKIAENIKFPNFKPKLVRMFSEDAEGAFAILNLCYSNSSNNSRKNDRVIVRVIPLFAIADAVMHRLVA
jgi:hypothetical protein